MKSIIVEVSDEVYKKLSDRINWLNMLVGAEMSVPTLSDQFMAIVIGGMQKNEKKVVLMRAEPVKKSKEKKGAKK